MIELRLKQYDAIGLLSFMDLFAKSEHANKLHFQLSVNSVDFSFELFYFFIPTVNFKIHIGVYIKRIQKELKLIIE